MHSVQTVAFLSLSMVLKKSATEDTTCLIFFKGIFGLYEIQISSFLIIVWTQDYHKCFG